MVRVTSCERLEGGTSVTQTLNAADNPSPFDSDGAYLQQTLRHEPMELGLDDSVSLRTVALLFLRAYVVWIISFFILAIIGIFASVNSGNGYIALFLFIISIVIFWVVLLGSKVTEPIGEWRVLLADRAGSAESYHRVIATVLNRRHLPIGYQLRRIELSGTGRPVKHTIVLFENEYQAYVTVFPYGTSLYVGWQMWRRRSGAQLIARALSDRVNAAGLVTAMLRTDRARAMREAVHLACREAVYVRPDEAVLAQANALQLPQVEQESALLPQQPASPALPSAQPSPQGSPLPPAPAPRPAAHAAPAPPQQAQGPAPTQPFRPLSPQPSPFQPPQPEPPAAPIDATGA